MSGTLPRSIAVALSFVVLHAPALTVTSADTDPSGKIRFIDVAPRVRFDYTSNNDFTGRKYFPQPMCGGIIVFDYDNDGRLDVFFSNGAKMPELVKIDRSFYNCLLRADGDGTFEDVTTVAGIEGRDLDFTYGIAAGDYDNDGDMDIFFCQTGPNALFRNDGDGTFTDVTKDSGLDTKPKDLLSVCAAWFDFDNDGRLDLIVSQYTHWSPTTDVRCPLPQGGEFYCSPRIYKSVPHALYHNEGNGTFRDVTVISGFGEATDGKGMGIGTADFNNDGLIDVFVSNDTEPNFLYLNKGDGTFVEEAWMLGVAYNDEGNIVSGMGADAKDFDNDGWVDIFYNNLKTQIWALFHNEKGRQFHYVTPAAGIALLSRNFSGWSNGFIDYDNDGWKDIYSSNGDVDYLGENTKQHDTMFRNIDGAKFEDVSESLGADFLRMGFQRGSAFGDLNDDGFLDLVVTSLNERPRILLNSGGKGGHWLIVGAEGRRSNRDGIGAKIKVTTASGRVLHNHVTTSAGFMSSPDKRPHFGLGGEGELRSVEVRWPSGKIQEFRNVRADQVLRIVELDETDGR